MRLQQQGGGVTHLVRLAQEADVPADAGGRAVPLHQPAHQPGGVAVGEDLGQHHIRQVAGEVGHRVRHPPGAGQGRQRGERVDVAGAPLGGQVGLGELRPLRRLALRYVAEVRLHQAGGRSHLEVAGDGEHGVAGRVVLLEEVLSLGHRGALQVDEGAVPVVRVGERVEHHRRQLQPREPAVRPVQHVDPDLLLDHVDLVAQVLLGEAGTAHPVGLQEQRPLQGVGRQRLEVVGVVQVGGAVERPAGALHVAEVGQLLQVRRALEHQVLEEVGEAGPPLRLGADAHVVDDRHAHHRGGRVGREHHAQAVRQGEPLHRVPGRRNLPGGSGLRGRALCRSTGRHPLTITRHAAHLIAPAGDRPLVDPVRWGGPRRARCPPPGRTGSACPGWRCRARRRSGGPR